MDQNQQPTQPVQTAAPPVTTPPPQPQPFIAPTPKSANKLLLSMIVVMFFLAIGIGAYIFIAQQQTSQQPISQTTPQSQIPTAVPTVAQTAEEREVELIDLGSLDADFADIDADLQGL